MAEGVRFIFFLQKSILISFININLLMKFVFPFLFNRKGKNGKACVLRALCETGQQNENDVKGSFLVEIMRAIFTLPDQMKAFKKEHHEIYDKAHNSVEKDCSETFAQCQDSIWAPDFVF